MELPTKTFESNDLIGLMQFVQDLLQSQAVFLSHLTIEEFRTNKKLYDQIVAYNRTMQSTLEKLISRAPLFKKV